MIDRRYLRTHDLAQAGDMSVQQVRNYEASNLIPKAERSSSNYRLYTQHHLAALKTVKSMVPAYGWPRTAAIMQALHQGDLAAALALIDTHHAALANKRLQLEQTLESLRVLSAQTASLSDTWRPQQLRVGEAAKQVGVRVSALHFWEQQGLLHPVREKSSHYRLYDEVQMRRLRVVVLLREVGYDFHTIHATLDELAAGQPEKAITAVEKRHGELARTSWFCLIAMSAFQSYVSDFYENLCLAL